MTSAKESPRTLLEQVQPHGRQRRENMWRWAMLVQEMTEAECLNTLARTRLGRLACAHQNQPYIVPIYFAYEQPYLYAFTTPGQKVEWMRYNPLVCLEVDEVEDS